MLKACFCFLIGMKLNDSSEHLKKMFVCFEYGAFTPAILVTYLLVFI